MPAGIRPSAQMVNGRWWFLKNSNGTAMEQPVNGRWWFLKNNTGSSQAYSTSGAWSSTDANSRKFIDPTRSSLSKKQ